LRLSFMAHCALVIPGSAMPHSIVSAVLPIEAHAHSCAV
jgi:hypothetical protein